MSAILRRQPLTIKQQVEELMHWHKQQQSKLDPQTLNVENAIKKNDVTNSPSDLNSIPSTNFDEIPIQITNSNFNALVENNVASFDSHPAGEIGISKDKANKTKFRFLKKGEGIARFKMGPPKHNKKFIPRKQSLSLNLSKDKIQSDVTTKRLEVLNDPTNEKSKKVEDISTLKVPDVKLNVTWKSIFSGKNPEEMLEKAVNSNEIEMMDLNSSIDSYTATQVEKLLAYGNKKLIQDKEELQVYETIEQHVSDSSFCSSSSYVTKLMENAVISTPNKNTIHHQPLRLSAPTSIQSGQLSRKVLLNEGEECFQKEVLKCSGLGHPTSYTSSSTAENNEKVTKTGIAETKIDDFENHTNKSEQKLPQLVASWAKPIINQDHDITVEQSDDNLEQSLHVRFAEQVDYKSFMEQTQSIDSVSQVEEFDESHEWREVSEDSSSCCSQGSKHELSTEDVRTINHQNKQIQPNYHWPQNEGRITFEKLNLLDFKTNNNLDNNEPSSNDGLNIFLPILIEKQRELEAEIQIFQKENSNIKNLRDSLERERRKIQEENRHLSLEKKKLKKEIEEEKIRLTTLIEEEKQKLAKEKAIFEKYSKQLTKNPSKEERKEIQALREQLAEIKEELNKKESRWGAAQARVRNQVKFLEEDNKKLREEIENFRKQSKFWELFNQKKKGKPLNNTRLIHAISEHISNIVLDDENSQEKSCGNAVFSSQKSSNKISSISQSDLKCMYGVRVVKENKNNSNLPSKQTSESVSNIGDIPSVEGVENINVACNSNSQEIIENSSTNPNIALNQRNFQNEDRCKKPCLEEESSHVIKEVVDKNGNMEIVFPDGNIKKVNKITGSEKYIYINGDVEEITEDGTVKYYYSNSRIWQTTLPDGLEIIDFPDGKVEKRHIDGTIEIIDSNNNKKISYPDGAQEIIYTDGTRLKTTPDKTHILTLPNGQKEIRTEEWKRREYPDGTIKTLYPDGTTETVYSNGRVRLRDKYGNLVMDSDSHCK